MMPHRISRLAALLLASSLALGCADEEGDARPPSFEDTGVDARPSVDLDAAVEPPGDAFIAPDRDTSDASSAPDVALVEPDDAAPPAPDATPSPDAAPCVSPAPVEGFHVTLDGAPDGDGTLAAPWDIRTALNDPPRVAPGDTIWVHGGVYEGTFVIKQDGEADAPITIRAWPGDRVTLDAAGAMDDPVVQIYRRWTILRGLEITNSGLERRAPRPTGIYVGGDDITLVNLAIHDAGSGVSGGRMDGDGVQEGVNLRLHGCLIYNNGWIEEDRAHGHNLYLTNRDGEVHVEESLVFHAYGFGVHNYSDSDRHYVEDNYITGNVWFLNGAPGGKLYDNCMVGHDGSHVVRNTVLRENYGWAAELGHRGVRMGWDTPNEGGRLEGNYLVGQTIFQGGWGDVHIEGNTFIGEGEAAGLSGVSRADHPDNAYLSGAPSENHVVIRPNGFAPGRAHVIVYNWEGLDAVTVDLSAHLTVGAAYRLRNAEDYFGAPVLEGIYGGGAVEIPMTGLTPAPPIGEPNGFNGHHTGAAFNVFVLESDACP